MDKNTGIGMALIAVMLITYFYFFSPTPPPPTQTPAGEPITDTSTTQKSKADSAASQTTLSAAIDTIHQTALGKLNMGMQEEIISIETEDLLIDFSNKGGVIKKLGLKKYTTYQNYDQGDHEPLILIDEEHTSMKLLTTYENRELDLFQEPIYAVNQSKKGDTTIITFSLAAGQFRQVYEIPNQGYEIKYRLEGQEIANQFTAEELKLLWHQEIPRTEKDLKDSRNKTTITYYQPSDGFDDLDDGTEVFGEAPDWVAIKQKYFLSALIAPGQISQGKIVLTSNGEDTTIVKSATVELGIKKQTLAADKPQFKFYFGPNDYQLIGDVAPDFAKNVYLGWPPVYWVNKFVIFPVFNFLTHHISNYGVIIIILVLLMRAVLAPLSYRSYLSMAKMKVLKPELDEIKEKNGDDAAAAQQEQLKLYRQVGVNPISGCIPVVLQMPILFAMFYLFPASIELRQQPLLWAEDLSTYDSLISIPIGFLDNHISIFTLLMTLATIVSTWQNNQISSVQGPMKSMGYIMPIIFFFVLNSFSAGLTFYYFVSTLITFGQQALIRKFVNEEKIKNILEENRRKNKTSGGKKSKFMAKLEEAMKAGQEAKKVGDQRKKGKKK